MGAGGDNPFSHHVWVLDLWDKSLLTKLAWEPVWRGHACHPGGHGVGYHCLPSPLRPRLLCARRHGQAPGVSSVGTKDKSAGIYHATWFANLAGLSILSNLPVWLGTMNRATGSLEWMMAGKRHGLAHGVQPDPGGRGIACAGIWPHQVQGSPRSFILRQLPARREAAVRIDRGSLAWSGGSSHVGLYPLGQRTDHYQ